MLRRSMRSIGETNGLSHKPDVICNTAAGERVQTWEDAHLCGYGDEVVERGADVGKEV